MSAHAIAARTLGILLCGVLLLDTGCDDESPTGTEKINTGLEVSEPNLTLSPGLQEQLVLWLLHDDGSKTDVTQDATWSSENDNVATVVGGLVTAGAAGVTSIKGALSGFSASSEVTVEQLAAGVGAHVLVATSSGVARYFTDGATLSHEETFSTGNPVGALAFDSVSSSLQAFRGSGPASVSFLEFNVSDGAMTLGAQYDFAGSTLQDAELWSEGRTLAVNILQPPGASLFEVGDDNDLISKAWPLDNETTQFSDLAGRSIPGDRWGWFGALSTGTVRAIFQDLEGGMTELQGSGDQARSNVQRIAVDRWGLTSCAFLHGAFGDLDAFEIDADNDAISFVSGYPLPITAVAADITRDPASGQPLLVVGREDQPTLEFHHVGQNCELDLKQTIMVGFDHILDITVVEDGLIVAVTGYNDGEPTTDYLEAFVFQDGVGYVPVDDPVALGAIAFQVILISVW